LSAAAGRERACRHYLVPADLEPYWNTGTRDGSIILPEQSRHDTTFKGVKEAHEDKTDKTFFHNFHVFILCECDMYVVLSSSVMGFRCTLFRFRFMSNARKYRTDLAPPPLEVLGRRYRERGLDEGVTEGAGRRLGVLTDGDLACVQF
jgi:hypothetical protein